MQFTIIPICRQTQPMLAELNNGVVPLMENENTYFIYKGPAEVPEILRGNELVDRFRDVSGPAGKFTILCAEDYSE